MARSLKSVSPDDGSNSAGMIDGAKAKKFLDRMVRLEEEVQGLKEDIKEVYAEAKRAGFVTKVLRQKVKEMRLSETALIRLRSEQEYMDRLNAALGEFANTPLGVATIERHSAA